VLVEVGSSGKVTLSEKVVLVLLAVEAIAVKEGSGFLSSRRILGRAITACTIKGGCHQGGCEFSKQVKGESTSLLIAAVAGRAVTGARGSGSIGASRASQV